MHNEMFHPTLQKLSYFWNTNTHIMLCTEFLIMGVLCNIFLVRINTLCSLTNSIWILFKRSTKKFVGVLVNILSVHNTVVHLSPICNINVIKCKFKIQIFRSCQGSLCNFWGEDRGDFNLCNVFHSVLIRLYCLMFCTTINIGKMSLNFLQAAGFYYTSIDTRHYIKLKQKIHSFCCVFQSFFSWVGSE